MAKVFISSTFQDLQAFRAGISLVLNRLGHDPIGMESYAASDESPLEVDLRQVVECDLFISIVAWRYGYIPPGHDQSIVELEYRKAVEIGKDRLIFLLDETAPWPRADIDPDSRRVEAFRQELLQSTVVAFFSTPEELAALVASAVTHWAQVRGRENLQAEVYGGEHRYQIFINYRHQDTAYQAAWLYTLLSQDFGREQVFIDFGSLELGDRFPLTIANSITSCKTLLALMGKDWLDAKDEEDKRRLDDPDDFVRFEIEVALKSDVVVIPVRFERARELHKGQLPSTLRPLADRHGMMISAANFEQDTRRLVESIKRREKNQRELGESLRRNLTSGQDSTSSSQQLGPRPRVAPQGE
jgi:hypothetical protein